MSGPRRWGGVSLAVALVLAACVGGGSDAIAPGDRAETPAKVGADLQPFRSLPVDSVITIRRKVSAVFDRCMAAWGFPQFLDYEVPEEAITVVDDIGLGPYSFGPVTESEARRHGYSPLLGLPPSFPQVVSQDDAFDQAAAECRQTAWDGLDREAEDTVRAVERLAESLHNAFVDSLRASEEFRRLHQARVACLAEAGFSARDGGVWLRPEARTFGLRFGKVEEIPRSDNPEPGPGKVVVMYPPERRYIPSDQEVELALADVACRRHIGFRGSVAGVAASIQDDLLTDVEANLVEMRITLDRIVASLDAEDEG